MTPEEIVREMRQIAQHGDPGGGPGCSLDFLPVWADWIERREAEIAEVKRERNLLSRNIKQLGNDHNDLEDRLREREKQIAEVWKEMVAITGSPSQYGMVAMTEVGEWAARLAPGGKP